VTPLFKFLFEIVNLVGIVPTSAARTIQVLADAVAKLLPCAAADVYPITTRDNVPDEAYTSDAAINKLSRFDRARMGICVLLVAIDEAFVSCGRNKLAQKSLDRMSKAIETSVGVNGGFNRDIDGGMGGVSGARYRQVRDEPIVQHFLTNIGAQRLEALTATIEKCDDNLWNTFEDALAHSSTSTDGWDDDDAEPTSGRRTTVKAEKEKTAVKAEKDKAPGKPTATRGRGRGRKTVMSRDDEEQEDDDAIPAPAPAPSASRVKAEPVVKTETTNNKRAKSVVSVVDLADSDESDDDLEIIAVKDTSKRR